MTTIQDILQKTESLVLLESELNKLVSEFNLSGLTKRPEFSHFGWSRFSEFVNQLKQARIGPIFEEIRQELLKSGLVVDPRLLAKSVEEIGEHIVEIASTISENLLGISNGAVKIAAVNDVYKFLRAEDWAEANTRAARWTEEEKGVVGIINNDPDAPSEAMFSDLANLGPEAETATHCQSLREKTNAIGGLELWAFVTGKDPESLQVLETKLRLLEDYKTQIEIILGKSYSVPTPKRRSSTFEDLEHTLQSRLDELRVRLGRSTSELRTAEIRAADYALLLDETTETAAEVASLEEIHIRMQYLKTRIRQLSGRLKKNLSVDALTLIESLGTGVLPSGFNNDQIVIGLTELLEGHRLRVELKDA